MDTQVTEYATALLLRQLQPSTGRVWALNCNQLTIGRDPDAQISVEDPELSRHHANLVRHGSTWVVVDCGSTNGTAVNGIRVQQAALRPGDRIVVGRTELMLDAVVPTAPPPPPPPGQSAIRYDVGSQAGNINNVGGNQANYYHENALRYIATRRGRARNLIVWGIALFFVGQGLGVAAVLSFQRSIFDEFGSTDFSGPDVPAAFFPMFAAGALLTLLGLALFVFGLIARSGAKREAYRVGAPW